MSEQHEAQPFGRNTCHICGGTEFMWGYANELSETGLCFTESTQPPKKPHTFVNFNYVQIKPIRARCCVTCNNVQFFAVDEDKMK